MNLWTEQQDELLEQLCAAAEKYSAPAIAKIISDTFDIQPPLSRAAVVGRARRRRLTLPLPRKWGGKRWPPTDDGGSEPKPTPQHNFKIERTQFARDYAQPYRHEFIPEPALSPGLYLINASDRDCRWPINDPPKGEMQFLRVCGDMTEEGKTYCPACLRADALRYRPSSEPTGRDFVLPSKQRGLK